MDDSTSKNLDITSNLPYDYVRERMIIALEDDDICKVYSPNHIDIKTYQELCRFLDKPLDINKCSAEEFNEMLTKSFDSKDSSEKISEELSDDFDLESFAGNIAPTEDLLNGNNDAPIIKLINGIISQAIKQRASDVHFEPYEDQLVIRFRIDGILKEVLSQDSRIASLVIARIKIISRLDISERRLPQDGRVSLSLGDKNVDVRVSTLPSSYGERIVLRLSLIHI